MASPSNSSLPEFGTYEYGWEAKKPTLITPQAPHAPCTAKASSGSSILSLWSRHEAPWRTKAPRKPMTMETWGVTTGQPAVMLTKPPRMPLQVKLTSNWPEPPSFGGKNFLMHMAVMPPTAADMVVVTQTRA